MFGSFWIWWVIPLLVTVGSLVFWFKFMANMQKGAQNEARLLQTGAPATGQIVAVNQTGVMINNQPQVQIVVTVHPPGGQPYQAQMTKIVSMFEISQYQIGSQVHVRYDPQNPANIAIATQQQVMMQQPMMAMQQPQAGYPQQPQAGYPPQPGGYPPQGGGYPPQGGGPPPNYGA